MKIRPKTIVEGRGIKVYRLPEKNTFAVFEGWGWEDVWKDMVSDKGVRRLQRDVVRLLRDGTPMGLIEDNLDHLIDKASTRLTTEEKVVFLKWLEKNKKRLTPELGLDAYNRSRRPVTEARYASTGPQSGFTDQQVIQTFFDVDQETTEEAHDDPDSVNWIYYVPKPDAVVQFVDNNGGRQTLDSWEMIIHDTEDDEYFWQNVRGHNEETHHVNPSKFTIYTDEDEGLRKVYVP